MCLSFPARSIILVYLLVLAATGFSACAPFLVRPEKVELESRPYIYPEQFIDVNNARMCYVENGAGQPLIFIHGLMGCIYAWEDNMPSLSKKFKVYALDLPGFGKSQKGDLPYTIDFFTEVLRQFIQKKQIHRPVIIGISLGGHLAIDYSVRYPGEVDRIVVVGSTGGGRAFNFLEDFCLRLIWHDFVVRQFISPVELRRAWNREFRHPNERTDAMFRERLQFKEGTRNYDLYVHSFSRTLFSILHDDLKKQYPKVKVPALILWGRYDYYHKVEDAHEMNRLIPNSKLKIFEDCGHVLMHEDPENFNQAVEEFVLKSEKKNGS